MKSELRIFAYGTLKRGYSNHDLYCSGVLRVYPAWVRGKLFKTDSEIPVMKIPNEDVLLHGSASVTADIEAQDKFDSFLRRKAEKPGQSCGAGEWGKIQGELHIFDDPETRLPLLDSLEEFHSNQPSVYTRALVFINLPNGSQTTAWTYIAGSKANGLREYEGESWDLCADSP